MLRSLHLKRVGLRPRLSLIGLRYNSSFNTNFTAFPTVKNTLYDSSQEKDSCGVGLVAHLKKIPSRSIVVDANEMLVRMSHRGGCGCEPNAGDGAGMLVGMPHSYYTKVVKESLQKDLGPINSYGTGIMFLPKDPKAREAIKDTFLYQVESIGFKVIGWRQIKTCKDRYTSTT
jgi:glutamate synthase domain-containing protein 1